MLSLGWAFRRASGVSGKALFLDLVLFIRVFMMTCKLYTDFVRFCLCLIL